MAAYLVAAGSAPEAKKGPAAADAAKTKSKKGEQLAAQPQAESAEAIQPRTLRGKERQQAKAHDEARRDPRSTGTPAERRRFQANGGAATPPLRPPLRHRRRPRRSRRSVLNIPMPALPEGPPTDLVQSFFSSSPLP